MKKVSLFLFVFLLGVCLKGFSQTTTPPTDFYAGKWEITIAGSPRGDVKYLTDLVRQDGKLKGELVDSADTKEKRPITKVVETANKLVIYFESSQAGEMSMDLTKVDENTIRGSLMDFETTAKRVK
jgi:hypothetical protein